MTQFPAPLQYAEPAVPTPDGARPSRTSPALQTWLVVGILALLFGAIFWPNGPRLFRKSFEPNWQHALLVPVVSLFYLFRNRQQMLAADLRAPHWRWQGVGVLCMLIFIDLAASFLLWAFRPSLLGGGSPRAFLVHLAYHVPCWGLAGWFLQLPQLRMWTMRLAHSSSLWFGLLCAGLSIAIYSAGAKIIRNHFIIDSAMIWTLFGLVLLVGGWRIMRVAWFPIVFLFCAVPWPPLLYSKVAMPLQELAAEVAVFVLQITGVAAERHGTIIDTPVRPLDVAEACAGMKSLMTFFALGGAVAFLSARPLWQRLVIWFASVPIAILCNVARVSGQGLIDYYVSQNLTTGLSHALVGLLMMIPAFFLLMSVGWIIDVYVNAFSKDDDEAEAEGTESAGSATVVTRKRRKAMGAVQSTPVPSPQAQDIQTSKPQNLQTPKPQEPVSDLAAATMRLTSSTHKRSPKPQPARPPHSDSGSTKDHPQGPAL